MPHGGWKRSKHPLPHEDSHRHELVARLGCGVRGGKHRVGSLVIGWRSHAEDSEIMAWASVNDFVVFTHDLDFGAILALTRAEGPSVVQVRNAEYFSCLLIK